VLKIEYFCAMQKPVLVIKLGTAVLTNDRGELVQATIKKIAAEVATLSARYRMVLVSSGAVGSGKGFFGLYKGTLAERKAAAAVGNPILIRHYQKHFSMYGIPVAQALCERHHFSNRGRWVQLKDTFAEFWKNGILPIMNENDLVSNIELKFSDNDELATLTAIGFDAEALLLCTSVGGLLDENGKVIPRVLKGKTPFADALAGKAGTSFSPQASNLKARQKWLASGSITFGSIFVDKGAGRALEQRRSLLTVGIRKVQGKFASGEVVQLIDEADTIIGVAKARIGAGEVADHLSTKNVVAAHADDIVLF
jgi:glutamate 5-kinase